MSSGIVHVLTSGGRWIDAPDAYGPRKTLYNHFVRWSAKGGMSRSLLKSAKRLLRDESYAALAV